MPTIILNNNDIKKALNFLTYNKYHINTIIKKSINKNGEIEIFWSHKVV